MEEARNRFVFYLTISPLDGWIDLGSKSKFGRFVEDFSS
jgi:hypothetical protein